MAPRTVTPIGGPSGDPAPGPGRTTNDDREEGRRTGALPLSRKVGEHTAIPSRHDAGPAPITRKTPQP